MGWKVHQPRLVAAQADQPPKHRLCNQCAHTAHNNQLGLGTCDCNVDAPVAAVIVVVGCVFFGAAVTSR
jgi:hypothetical protein